MAPPLKKALDGSKFHKNSKKAFKSKKKTNEELKTNAMALQLEEEVPDFPRGGGSSVSRQKGAIHKQGEESMKTAKRGRIRGKHLSNEDDLGFLLNGGVAGNTSKYANKITLKNISPRMKLWGVVAEVNKNDLIISLPGGLRGLVCASDAFDPISEKEIEDLEHDMLSVMFHVGQLVPCVVLKVDEDKKETGKRKIWLSLRLSLLYKDLSLDALQQGMVLTSYVKSIEDHGYILHFGLNSFMGFLPKTSQSDQTEDELHVGQLLQGVIRSIDKTRKVVYLSSDPNIVSKCVAKDLKGLSIDLLIPGMMVSARVQSTLENGIMLSFLTYFSGTVDMFHLQNSFHSSNWKTYYTHNMKVNARILFIDPSTRAVGLTLIPHLVQNKAAPSYVKIGDIYDTAKVLRVDRGLGLLLEVPSSPESTPTHVTISDVAEEDVKKIEKKFKEGSRVRVRILGFRHLEGLAIGTLKASAFEGPVFSYTDVKPGMVVQAKVIAVDDFGAIVQFPGGLKALCPLSHMSEFEIARPRKKFKIGAELVFRVLGCKSKRITVTHKKALVKSKLDILSSYADATSGLVTHGWITKIENHGCFVRFYNGVQGFAPRSELGIEPGADPSSTYHVGQVIKCRITSYVPSSKRVSLSFIMKSARVYEDEKVELGSIVSGVVDEITQNHVTLCINRTGYSRGRVSTEHLSDHQAQAAMMKLVLKPGYQFDKLVVLDIDGSNLILSAKHSLINFAHQLPFDIGQINQNSVIHGFICNIIETGCFVRFLGRLTGFSPRYKSIEDQKFNLSEAFYIGQSVRTGVLDVRGETGRITLSLKQSTCFSTDASFIAEYFSMEEKIARLHSMELNWAEEFAIGSVVEGQVQEVKDIGVTLSFEKYHDVFGFIPLSELSGFVLQTGSTIQAAVLDVSKRERLVDLSLKPEFVDKCKGKKLIPPTRKKRKAEVLKDLEVNQIVNAVVEVVKEHYLVLSLPDYGYALGYASTYDYNTQRLPQKQFRNGQRIAASVVLLPCPSTFGRLLLLLKSLNEANETPGSKRLKKNSTCNVGSLVHAEITEIQPLEMKLKFGVGLHGRVHVTEVNDESDDNSEAPFSNFRVGQTVAARIIGKANLSTNKKNDYLWELSVKPKILKDFNDVGDEVGDEYLNLSIGQRITAFVCNISGDWAWLSVTRRVSAQLFILDSSNEPSELQDFSKRFSVGKAISGYVSNINREKRVLRLVLHHLPTTSSENSNGDDLETGNRQIKKESCHFNVGDSVGGRISKILPGVGGLLVQVGPRIFGRVHYTELTDNLIADPLSGYCEGQFVKCKVIEVTHSAKGTTHIDLSLRSSTSSTHRLNNIEHNNYSHISCQRVEKIEDIHSHMEVKGYVKNVSPKGCFILLSRGLEAKILLSNLSDGYIDDPEKEFPVGKLVTGRVLSFEPLSKRIEVTLTSVTENGAVKANTYDLSSFSAGDVISGRIKRVESYGLFISIDNTDVVGLCHVSEISDDRIDNLEIRYHAGDMVKAKILKVDKQRHRIRLGMKKSYVEGEGNGELFTRVEQGQDDLPENDNHTDGIQSSMPVDCSSIEFQNMDDDIDDNENPLTLVESRAFVPPLEVNLDDIDDINMDNVRNENTALNCDADSLKEKNDRRLKKKAKEEREKDVRAAEERLLQKDIPTNADEFEKLIRSSPNSSFLWIKYMAFMLSLADIEKARAIAERALRTINIREENEKLNVWLAYFNLENEYGNPPGDAVTKVFERALQSNDPKKVHLALLGMYERTEQHELADDLLGKMIKRFKHSCKVWLGRIRSSLKHRPDEIQSVVNRALLSLPRRKHIKFISQTAILEFKCGVADRGRSMFEGVLREYPKRTDLWSIYLDQEIRLGDADMIRALFERATTLSLPPKKMKFLFKKYLEYEKSVGDEERIESVKQKALQYVESTLT